MAFFCVGKALGEGNQWYFYSRRTQNRVTVNGYWKAMGMEDTVIASSNNNKKVGMKKYFVFYYEGDQSPNSDIKTNWVMQEYHLSDSSSSSSSRRSQSKPVSQHTHTNTVVIYVTFLMIYMCAV